MDVARYGEDQAHNPDYKNQSNAWLYQDSVVRAYSQDTLYDRFLALQIAADLIPDVRPSDRAALEFLGLGQRYYYDGMAREAAQMRLLADDWDNLSLVPTAT